MHAEPSAFAAVAPILAELHGENPLVTRDSRLIEDLGFDELDLADIEGALIDRFGLSSSFALEDVTTVQDIVAAVEGARQ